MADQEDYNYNCNLQQFQRNRYFYGKLMSVRDFETEQSYMNEKRHLLNRLVKGAGIVCGLDGIEVGVEEGQITLTFAGGGVALDNCGREIMVPPGSKKGVLVEEAGQAQSNLSTTTPGQFYLFLRYEARDYELVNSAANPSSCEETCCPNRILEDFQVIATDTAPELPTVVCPDLSSIQAGETNAEEQAADIIKNWAKERVEENCSGCNEDGVFILALTIENNSFTIEDTATRQHISLVYNNKLLSQLVTCHITDFDNPHKTTAAQLGALESINSVTPDENGDVELLGDLASAIAISADIANNTITIGENHSSITTGNPHNVTATETGALVSISGISNPGGNVQLLADNMITLNTDINAKSITIGESHSSRTDNPHSITVGQIMGAFPDTGGTIDGAVSITTGGAVSISGSLVSIASGRLLSITSGTLFSQATDSFAIRGLLAESGVSITSPGVPLGLRPAAVEGISTVYGTIGVYAYASTEMQGQALYVDGNAYVNGDVYVAGSKGGYVVDTFKNADDIPFETGDVVKLKGTQVARFQGINNNIPVAEVILADQENDTRTIGIVDRSTAEDSDELLVVTLGAYARCKVDASAAPIEAGDLLTSSNNPGYAVKAVNPQVGTIIGKALEPLAEGTGYIAVFVNIQ